MAHAKLSLESVLKARQALQTTTARFTKQEAAAMATLNDQLRPLGFQIERVEPASPGPAQPPRSWIGRKRPSPRALRCTVARCGRTFRFPMHLGRHLRTVHGQKG